MALFNPREEDEVIDISDQEETVEETTELPDEVNVDNETEDDPEPEEEAQDIEEPEEPETPEEPQPEESSLTTEPEAQPETETTEPVEVSDEQIFAALSEKLGREVKSYEDLATQEAPDPFDGDEELQAIAEWKKKTGRPLSDWSKYQKDYNSLSNEAVVREYLQHQYPEFTPEDIDLEMQDYIVDEDSDLDSDIAKKNLRLKKAAITARQELGKFKTEFETPVEPKLTKEQKEAVDFYNQYKEQSTQRKEVIEQYTAGITAESSKVKSLPLQLADDLSIDLNLSESERKELPKLISETPQWFNEDGSYNHKAIVSDAIKMNHFDKAVKLAYEQGVAKGREEDDAESRNVNLDKARQVAPGGSKDEIVIEGADEMDLNGGTLRFKTR